MRRWLQRRAAARGGGGGLRGLAGDTNGEHPSVSLSTAALIGARCRMLRKLLDRPEIVPDDTIRRTVVDVLTDLELMSFAMESELEEVST